MDRRRVPHLRIPDGLRRHRRRSDGHVRQRAQLGRAKSRGFLFFCSAALTPVMAVCSPGNSTKAPPNPPSRRLSPYAPIIALWLGLIAGHKLDKHLFRRLTYALLIAVSIFAILSPLLAKQ